MKYYLLYFLDYKNKYSISIKADYQARDDALINLEKVALEYVKDQQGKQQMEICKRYDDNVQQILTNPNIKEGLYLKKRDDMVVLYEKVNVVVTGTLWNSMEMQVNEIGLFGITDYNLELLVKCSCNVAKTPVSNSIKPVSGYTFLDQLKERLLESDNNYGLRSIRQPIVPVLSI